MGMWAEFEEKERKEVGTREVFSGSEVNLSESEKVGLERSCVESKVPDSETRL